MPVRPRAFMAVLAGLALTLAARADAALRFETAASGDAASVRLAWDEAVNFTHRVDGRDLALRFSSPLGGAALENVQAALPGWVDTIRYGYDSVLIRAAPGVTPSVAALPDGTGVTIRLEAPPTSAAATPEAAAERRRIEMMRGRTQLAADEPAAARTTFRRLMGEDPRDIEAIAAAAETEERLGGWRESLRLYGRALAIDPDDPDLLRARARLLHERGSYVRTDVVRRSADDGDAQTVATFAGHALITETVTGGVNAEARWLEARPVRRADGGTRSADGTYTRTELWAARAWGEGHETRLALLEGPHGVGAAMAHRWSRPGAETSARFELRQPEFGYVEAIADEGRRDRLSVRHDRDLGGGWSAGAGAAATRYGIAGDDDAARTVGLEAGVRHALMPAAPYVGIGYMVEAEYVLGRTESTDTAGTRFAPMPVVDREVHFVDVTFADDLTDYLRYSVSVGYAFDRLGSHGATVGGALTYEPLANLEIGLRLDRTIASGRDGGGAVTTGGVYAKTRF